MFFTFVNQDFPEPPGGAGQTTGGPSIRVDPRGFQVVDDPSLTQVVSVDSDSWTEEMKEKTSMWLAHVGQWIPLSKIRFAWETQQAQ